MKYNILFLSFCFLSPLAMHAHPVCDAEDRFFEWYEKVLAKQPPKRYLVQTTISSEVIKNFGAKIMYQDCCTKVQARSILVESVNQFLAIANADKSVSKYFDPKPMTLDRLRFIIAFWDKEMERPARPSLAEVELVNGTVHYRYKREDSEALSDQEETEPYSALHRIKLTSYGNAANH